jgi:hypothetical protein
MQALTLAKHEDRAVVQTPSFARLERVMLSWTNSWWFRLAASTATVSKLGCIIPNV